MLMIAAVAAGFILMALAITFMVRNLKTGGLLGNPVRFLTSGALMVAHFPLVNWAQGLVQHELDRAATIDPDLLSAHWAAVIMVGAAQLIILPTSAELYAGFAYRRFGILPGSTNE
jgi:hypothetical protein